MNRLLTLAAAISLVLCVAFLILWVRSRQTFGPGDRLIFAARDARVWQVSAWRGAVWILTEPGFSHPRIVSAAVIPWRESANPREVTEIVLNVDHRSHPSTRGEFLGVFYRSDFARPGLIQSRSNWNPTASVWFHDYSHTKTYEGSEAVVFREILIPTWLLTLVTGTGGLYLLVPLVRWRRRRIRRREGCCMQCGYDLRASEGKCPECAAAIPSYAKPARSLSRS